MTEIKLHKTTDKALKLIGMSILFVIIGIWMITREPAGSVSHIMACIFTSFFGLGIPIGLFNLFDKQPQIIINENGIWDKTTLQDEIKWEQIIEASPLYIFRQEFISIVLDDTFTLKKKPDKWNTKINEILDVKNLNLSLGQINIDVIKLTELIQTLSKSEKKDREQVIRNFQFKKRKFTFPFSPKTLFYTSISIVLLLISLTGITGFMSIGAITGGAALVYRWHFGSNKNSKIRKFARIMTWLGFINMILLGFTLKTHEYIFESAAQKISFELEDFKQYNSIYPNNLNSIKEKIDLNFLEGFLIKKIEYSSTEDDYEITITSPLFNREETYYSEEQEWY